MNALRITSIAVSLLAILPPCAGQSTSPTTVSLCEVEKTPQLFDHQLLRIHAYLSRGFEDSTLHGSACPDEALVNYRLSLAEVSVWVEFADEAHYWKVKGYKKLVEDEPSRRFRSLLQQRGQVQMTSATLIGTFYAGRPEKVNGRVTTLRGFGHMGCCALFIISRVESVDVNYSDLLNYSYGDWNIGLGEDCVSEQMLGLPENENVRSWQRAANDGSDTWRYEPKEVAADQLAKLKSGAYGSKSGGRTELIVPGSKDRHVQVDARPVETLLESESKPYRKRYEWIEPDHSTRFVIVVGRPYWLADLARSPERVIWVPIGASVLSCPNPVTGRKTH